MNWKWLQKCYLLTVILVWWYDVTLACDDEKQQAQKVSINVLTTWKFVWLFKISDNPNKGHEWPNFSGSTYFLGEQKD